MPKLLLALVLAMAWLPGNPGVAQETVRPGDRFMIHAEDLPPPYATPSAANSSTPVRRPEGIVPRVPSGFAVTLFAGGLENPRRLLVPDSGTVIAVLSRPGKLVRLVDRDGDGRSDASSVLASGFERPFGIALHGERLYVADTRGVWSAPANPRTGEPLAKFEPLTTPGAIGPASGHWTRNVAIHPDGTRMVVAIGSRGNLGEEPEPRATIQEFRLDGSGGRTVASGLRNPVGLAFQPGSDRLWTVVNERDGLGEELAPDYLARVVEGGFYGWPYAYAGGLPQPEFAGRRPDLVAATRLPEVLFRAHSAPIDMAFYDRSAFPAHYRGGAFVALHGSWNAAEPRGYTVVHVPFRDGEPSGGYEAFMTGFWIDGTRSAEVWGRPAGVAVGPDGALLVSDDLGGTIWRVTWVGR